MNATIRRAFYRSVLTWRFWRDPDLAYNLPRAWRSAGFIAC